MKHWLCIALLGVALSIVGSAQAAKLVSDGVLGNSGEQGTSLVRFGARVEGMGVAYDRFGTLWDRGGQGMLNRYAADGRLIGQYRIPNGTAWDKLTLVGDNLILLVNGQLYGLNITAKPGTAANALKIDASAISFGAFQGKIACLDKSNKQIFLLDAISGARLEVPVVLPDNARDIELGPDGTIYAMCNVKLYAIKDGKLLTEGWPKAYPGDRSQLIGDGWYGHASHGTIRRFNLQLKDDPGVVLGGSSGSFIGHLDENGELLIGRGITKLTDDLYAVSGAKGVLHLLALHQDTKQFEIVRRIGAISDVKGLGLDRQGRVAYVSGNWEWSDHPDAVLRNGIPMEICAQAVMLDNDVMVVPGYQYGSSRRLLSGKLSGLLTPTNNETFDFDPNITGCTTYKKGNTQILLTVSKDGKGKSYAIDATAGRYNRNEGPVTLTTLQPMQNWTTLAMRGADTLIAGVDGQVALFVRDGVNWKEATQWNSWGDQPDMHFGKSIYLTTDSDRLWVADSERHRVLVFDMATAKLVATFGTADKAGDTLTSLHTPTVIAARGERAVVFDSENQRIVKLHLTADTAQ